MQRFLKRLSSWIYLYHKGIVLFASLITILTTLSIFRLNIRTDILDVLPTKNPSIRVFVDFLNDFGTIDNLVIVLESDDNTVDEHFELVELIVERLRNAPFIEDIDYNILHAKGGLFLKNFPLYMDSRKGFDLLKERLKETGIRTQIKRNRHSLISPFSSPLNTELISKDPLAIRDILKDQFVKKGAGGLAFKGGYYISKDNSTLLILVKPTGLSRDMMFVMELKERLDHILSGALMEYGNPEGLHIGLTGVYAFAAEAQETIRKDIIYSFISSAVLIVLLFQFVYRTRPLVLIITAATLLTALSWTLGIAYLLFGGLNLVSSVVAAMLMGLGIDYIIHIFKRYEKEFVEKKDPLKALETTFLRTGVGVMTGAITTTLAFFSIIVTSFKGLHQLGIIAGLGVISCLVVTMVVMTSLLVWVGKARPDLLFQEGEGNRGLGTGVIAAIVRRYSKPLLCIGILLLIVSMLVGLPGVSFDSSPEKMGLKDSHSLAIENRVAERFGRQKNPLIIVKKAKTEDELSASFNTIEARLEGWQKEDIIESYTSPGLFIPPLSKQTVALARLAEIRRSVEIDMEGIEETFLTALKDNGFAIDKYSIDYIRGIQEVLRIDKPIRLTDLKEGADKKIKHFYNEDKLEIAAYIFSKDGYWEEGTLMTIKDDLSVLGEGWILLGSTLMFRELKGSIIKESIIAAIIAFAVVCGMLYLQFQSLRRVILVLLPLSLGFVYTIGLMGILNISFNYINIGAITLLFGIGVDYGIYILQGYLDGDGPDVERTIRQVGKSVIMCAITTIVGFGSLVTMRFIGIASLGVVISLGVALCLFTATLILPSILYLFEDQGSRL
ncbi:MAG: RND family transporter [Thermodesulfobacteriota bacterium]